MPIKEIMKPPHLWVYRLILFSIGLLCCTTVPAWAQWSASGSETQLNASDTTGPQIRPAITTNASGQYITVWTSYSGADGDGGGIYIKAADASGSSLISESVFNTTNTTGTQTYPDVAMNDNGDYVVAWMSNDGGGTDMDGFGIRHSFKTLAGTTVNQEAETNTATSGNQRFPAVAISSSGAYVVAWENDGDISAQLYTSAGVKNGTEFTVNADTANLQSYPDVAMDINGNFVVVWQSTGTDSSGTGVFGQRYNSFGVAQGSNFGISEDSTGNQEEPKVGMDDDGNFAVVWTDEDRDGSNYGIYGQRFNLDGTVNGSNFRINSTTSNNQKHPDISMAPNGAMVVTWASWGQDADQAGVFMQVYDYEGDTKLSQTQVNTYEQDFQTLPAVAMGDDVTGYFYVAWQSGENANPDSQDQDDYGIFLQGYYAEDLQDPIAVANDVTLYLDAVGDDKLTVAMVEGGSTDNIGIVSTTISKSNFDCSDIGTNTVTLTVTDAAGNTGTAQATITVLDTLKPTVGGRNLTVYLDGSNSASITVSDANNGTSTDNCGITLEGFSQDTFTCDDVGDNQVYFFGYDPSGNYDSTIITVTVIDSVAPTLTTQDVTVYLDGSGTATLLSSDLVSSASDNCAVNSVIASDTTFDCSNVGANAITVSISDTYGNETSAVATVTVIDSVGPTAIAQNLTAYLDGSGQVILTSADIDGGSTDNCGIVSMGLNDSIFSCSEIGVQVITLTVSDAYGNTDNATANVTIVDSVRPTVVANNLTAYLDGTGSVSITGADVDGGSSDNCVITQYEISTSVFTCSDVGANVVTLTVTDGSGNSSSATATITVVDSIRPSFTTTTQDVYLDANGEATIGASSLYTNLSDNCEVGSVVVSDTAFDCGELGTQLVSVTVTDVHGNSYMQHSTVNVLDSIAPTAVANDITLYLGVEGANEFSTDEVDAGSTDNCSGFSLQLTAYGYDCSNLGTNVEYLIVTDASGNMDSAMYTVTVLDTLAPTISVVDQTAYLDANGSVIVNASSYDNGTFDNCSFTLTASDSTFDCTALGSVQVISLTATDPLGNSSTATANLTVLDTISPTLSASNGTLFLDATGNGTLTLDVLNASASDNCTVDSLYLSKTAFVCSEIGTQQVTVTAVDNSGNTTTQTVTVTIDGNGFFSGPLDCDGIDLAGYWAMDHCEGTTVTNSNGTDGTAVGGSWYSGYINQMFQYDGTDDYIDLGNDSALAFTTSMTWSMWVRTTENDPYRTLVANNPDGGAYSYIISVNEGRPTVFLGGISSGIYQANSTITDGNWHHIAVTLDAAGELVIYIDGSADRTFTGITGSLNTNYSTSVTLGMRLDFANNYQFEGDIDEVRAYGGALTAAQISALASDVESPVACPASSTDLVGAWSMDDCNVTYVSESTSGTIDGTIYNDAVYGAGYNTRGIVFDGSNDYVDLHDSTWSLDADDSFTYSVWVNPSDISKPFQTLIWREGDAGLGPILQLHYGKPLIFLGGLSQPGPHSTGITLSENSWSNVVVTYSAGTLNMYVNGALAKTVTGLTGSINFGSGSHWLGMRSDNSSLYQFSGTMDEVRFFDVALTDEAAISEYTRISSSPATCEPAPLGVWKFDDCANSLAVDSLGANNGIFVGAVRAAGYESSGVSFDGVNDYINLGTSSTFELSNKFTISMWVYPTSYSAFQTLLTKNKSGSSFAYYVQLNNGKPAMYLGGTIGQFFAAPSALSLNTWSHIAFTLEGNVWKAYVNGVEVRSEVVTGTLAANAGSETWIGMRSDVTTNYQFSGSLDNIRMYDLALDSADIAGFASLAQSSSDCPVTRPVFDFGTTVEAMDIAVYPNPNQGSFTLRFNNLPSESMTITLTNQLGQTVYRHEGAATGQSHDIALDKPSPGVYFLTVWQGDSRHAQRVVIE